MFWEFRAVPGTPKTHHITPSFKSLHWLKITERITYKIISITRDILHTSQPLYLQKLIHITPPGPTRSSNYLTLIRPPISSLKISDRSFSKTAPTLWNKLPIAMRTLSPTPLHSTVNTNDPPSLSLSKAQFRAQLFHSSFPT